MDRSETRRGKQCWHLTSEGSSTSIYDAVLIKETVNDALKRYFNESNLYRAFFDSVSKTTFQLFIGHKLELEAAAKVRRNIDYLTPNLYTVVSRYKSSPIVRMSLQIAMYLANITNFKLHRDVEEIIHEMAYLAQIRVGKHFLVTCFTGN